MSSPASEDDDMALRCTGLRCSGPLDWEPWAWDYFVEDDVDDASRVFDAKKPRIRSHHRDSKRHGARWVDVYHRSLDSISAFDVLQTPWYATVTNERVATRDANPFSRDTTTMTLGVEYSVAKKKRWWIVDELSENIERYQNPESGLRTTLILEHESQAWRPHYVESELFSVDNAGDASRRSRRVDWVSAVQDLTGIPLKGYRRRENEDNGDARKSREKRRAPVAVKQRHIVYHAVEYRITNHQFNTTRKRTRRSPAPGSWDHPSSFVGGSKRYHPTRHRGRRQALNKLGLKEDVSIELDDGLDISERDTDVDDIFPHPTHFSLSDFVINDRNAKKAKARKTTPSRTCDEWVVVDDVLCTAQSDPLCFHSADAGYTGKTRQATRHSSVDALGFEWIEISAGLDDSEIVLS